MHGHRIHGHRLVIDGFDRTIGLKASGDQVAKSTETHDECSLNGTDAKETGTVSRTCSLLRRIGRSTAELAAEKAKYENEYDYV